MNRPHDPVLLNELVNFFDPKAGDVFVDCTFGAGGHTEAFLKAGATVLAIDRDVSNEKFALKLKDEYEQDRLLFENDLFSNLNEILLKYHFKSIKGVLYDLGVSSMQIDEADRGFSFQKDGPLEMQMGLNRVSAFDFVNHSSEEKLADTIYKYGEERNSRAIAKAIVGTRARKPIRSTLELAEIVKTVNSGGKIHPATRTFQAIRIAVNNELGEIEAIGGCVKNLPAGCKVAVITFHSLEDRIVKQMFNKLSGQEKKSINRNSSEIIVNQDYFRSRTLEVINKKPILAGEFEVKKNPRARSAKLRLAMRVEK